MNSAAEYSVVCAKLLKDQGIKGARCPCGAGLSGRGGKTAWCLDCSTPAKKLRRCGIAPRPKHTRQASTGKFTPGSGLAE